MKQNDIAKLPKWAQETVAQLKYRAASARKTLNEFQDTDTPSSIYYEDFIHTDENKGPTLKRKYVQSRRITIDHAGVVLYIVCQDGRIDLQWEDKKRGMNEVAMIPESFQKVRLVSRENMR